MSTLNISYEQHATGGDEPLPYTLVQLDGFIDAPNYPRFEQALERLIDSGRHHLVLECRAVEYINSTGISGIIRFHNQCQKLLQASSSTSTRGGGGKASSEDCGNQQYSTGGGRLTPRTVTRTDLAKKQPLGSAKERQARTPGRGPSSPPRA